MADGVEVDCRSAGRYGGLHRAGFLIPAMALLALLADLIGILVISVMQWVYLYRTARLFRDWTARM